MPPSPRAFYMTRWSEAFMCASRTKFLLRWLGCFFRWGDLRRFGRAAFLYGKASGATLTCPFVATS